LEICAILWIVLLYKCIQHSIHESHWLSTTVTRLIKTYSLVLFVLLIQKHHTWLAIRKSTRIAETLDFRAINCACVNTYDVIKITICSSQSADKILKSLMQFFPVWRTRCDSDQLR
jgi:hypothetical protein